MFYRVYNAELSRGSPLSVVGKNNKKTIFLPTVLRALAIESQVTVTARTRAHENPKCYSALYETAARSAAKICYRALCEMTARSAKICTILHEVVGCYSKFAFKASGEFHEPPPTNPPCYSRIRNKGGT